MTSPPSGLDLYEFIEQIGEGSFSSVWRVTHKATSQVYACKILPKANIAEPEDQARFQREINTMAFLRHPCLVGLHDFFADAKNFYMILDYCAGGELFDYICENDKLDETTAAFVFREIAKAVQFCHAFGVAHRDLKPENVLIDHFPLVKVSDFGLCGYISEKKLMGTFCGSPCYCSPECLSRTEYDGRKSDIWSLGVILFAMVTGEHPWNVDNTSVMVRQIMKAQFRVPSDLSLECQNLIYSMMRVDPNERLSMDDIMKHPWLERANEEQISGFVLPTVPTRPPTIEALSSASATSSQKREHGIVSPFERFDEIVPLAVDGAQLEAVRVCLPKLRVSASCLNIENTQRSPPREERPSLSSIKWRNQGSPARKQRYMSNGNLLDKQNA